MHTDSRKSVGIVCEDELPITNDILIIAHEEHNAAQPLLGASEQQQMAAWNATQQEYARDACIPQLVARQACITPDAIALVAGHQVMSYQQLNRRANQIARFASEEFAQVGINELKVDAWYDRLMSLIDEGPVNIGCSSEWSLS